MIANLIEKLALPPLEHFAKVDPLDLLTVGNAIAVPAIVSIVVLEHTIDILDAIEHRIRRG